MGGLTVLRALRERLPQEDFIYLGDTARLPYGTKSAQTVRRYAARAAAALVARGVRALVIACNTASAYALDSLSMTFAPLPVFGVIEPGAEACIQHALVPVHDRPRVSPPPATVVVLATEATVRDGAYARALLRRDPRTRVFGRPAPLLVALAETGEPTGPLAQAILQDALATPALGVTHLLLGCTHFPLFHEALQGWLAARTGPPAGQPAVQLIDSAATTAAVVAASFAAAASGDIDGGAASAPLGSCRFLATDDPQRFIRLGERFLGAPVPHVELIDL